MMEREGSTIASLGAVVTLPIEESSSSSLIKLLIFVAIFVGPAILKSIKDSQKKKKELAERAAGGAPPLQESQSPVSEAPEYEASTQEVAGGREQWERLMRGGRAEEMPVAPPPIPQVRRRRVLTESRPLTEEAPLTEARALDEAPALTDVRIPETATPAQSYDAQPAQKSPLLGGFAEFAPQEGLASDREGGPAKRIGVSPSFAGGDKFQDLSTAGLASEVTKKEIGGSTAAESATRLRRVRSSRFGRSELRRSILAAEVLGPPLALRQFQSGPTRPLGWS